MLPNEKLYQYRYDFDAQKFVSTGKVAENDSDTLKIEAEQDPKEYYRWYQLATNGDDETTASPEADGTFCKAPACPRTGLGQTCRTSNQCIRPGSFPRRPVHPAAVQTRDPGVRQAACRLPKV